MVAGARRHAARLVAARRAAHAAGAAPGALVGRRGPAARAPPGGAPAGGPLLLALLLLLLVLVGGLGGRAPVARRLPRGPAPPATVSPRLRICTHLYSAQVRVGACSKQLPRRQEVWRPVQGGRRRCATARAGTRASQAAPCLRSHCQHAGGAPYPKGGNTQPGGAHRERLRRGDAAGGSAPSACLERVSRRAPQPPPPPAAPAPPAAASSLTAAAPASVRTSTCVVAGTTRAYGLATVQLSAPSAALRAARAQRAAARPAGVL